MNVQIKRVYDKAEAADGKRVLVDGLWPRGLSRERARTDLWMKEIAPSRELRRWFAHREDRWETFRRCYLEELEHGAACKALQALRQIAEREQLTLVYAAKDTEHNNAVVLQQRLRELLDA